MKQELLPKDVFSPEDVAALLNHLDLLAKGGGSLKSSIPPNHNDVNLALDDVLNSTPNEIVEKSFQSMNQNFRAHGTSPEFLRYYIMEWLKDGYLMAQGKVDGVSAVEDNELSRLFANTDNRIITDLFDDLSLHARGYTREILIILTKLKLVPSYQPERYQT